MSTIDDNGALHDSRGRYADQNQPAAGYDLDAPVPDAPLRDEVTRSDRLLTEMIQAADAAERWDEDGAPAAKGRLYAFAEGAALVRDPGLAFDDAYQSDDGYVPRQAEHLVAELRGGRPPFAVSAEVSPEQRERIARHHAEQIAYAKDRQRHHATTGDVRYFDGKIEGHAAALVELVHSGQDAHPEHRQATNDAILAALGGTPEDVLSAYRARRAVHDEAQEWAEVTAADEELRQARDQYNEAAALPGAALAGTEIEDEQSEEFHAAAHRLAEAEFRHDAAHRTLAYRGVTQHQRYADEALAVPVASLRTQQDADAHLALLAQKTNALDLARLHAVGLGDEDTAAACAQKIAALDQAAHATRTAMHALPQN